MTTSMAMERPRVTQVKAIQLANEIFGLEVDLNSKKSAKELDSYDDRNFYLSGVKDGKPDAGIACPVPQKTLAGNYLEVRNLPSTPSNDQAKRIKLDDNLRPCIVCLFTFLPGKTMQDFKKNGHTFKNQFFLQLGQAVGNVANALKLLSLI
ncbi:uncharacterized protein LOC114521098 [Dendronephthya gigantea]|uniref:uncharacterized protein LOC114521098 n=1 Tax=Dendronephthya gigantea TaxID=151771 RepID=UPI00106D17A5|nr:uncharacterized protein LOC114521098 [Dendronephthya gigantea]